MMKYKIAFLTANDPNDKNSWSGTKFYMAKALSQHVGNVFFLGPIHQSRLIRIMLKCMRFLFKFPGLHHYNSGHSLLLSWYFKSVFSKKLSQGEYDVIIAPAASTEIALLKPTIPLVYLSDATFKLLCEYYPGLSGLSKVSKFEGNYIEKQAIDKADICVFSSQWAADSAVKDYGANPQKTFFIPFGANIDNHPTRDIINSKLNNSSDKCRLLFIARDWERKGGQIVLETLNELVKMGLDTELVILGCEPPQNGYNSRVRIYPFLDKNNPEEYNRFVEILKSSHFLLLPTRADCTPIVLSEANAYGIPTIATDTGGISSMVKNGINGFTLPLSATGVDYANLIYKNFSSQEEYVELVHSTKDSYDDWLNWDSWATQFKKILHESLN